MSNLRGESPTRSSLFEFNSSASRYLRGQVLMLFLS
jgi:hypothetical protein